MQEPTRMSEAEVVIRLAERFLRMPGAGRVARVAIDGAVIEMKGRNPSSGWTLITQKGTRAWHRVYGRESRKLL